MNLLFFIGRGIRWLGRREYLNFLNDKVYLELSYYFYMGEKLNIKNPITLNQKLQWLKLYDRRQEYCKMADKYEVKKLVANIIGEEYIIPTLGVWEKVDEIDFSNLPRQFVLKCTHDSKSSIICKDIVDLNVKEIKKKLEWSLNKNFYWLGREWVYKNIKPRIIAEKYLQEGELDSLRDYKFYCFNGIVSYVLVCLNRWKGKTQFYFFDKEWNLKRYNRMGAEAEAGFTLPKPSNLDEMFNIAQQLASTVNAPFLRVDLYNINGKIYFGELTFYPDCGMDRNRLPEIDLYFGRLIKLPNIN